jgi:hypothetical protein
LLAGFDLLREANLVVLGEERVLPDVGQVQPDEILFVAFDAIFRHRSPPVLGRVRSAV